jgi:hypothetical protein
MRSAAYQPRAAEHSMLYAPCCRFSGDVRAVAIFATASPVA